LEAARIQLHPALVLGPEAVELEFHHQPARVALIEEQIDVEVLVVDRDALLRARKARPLPSSRMKRSISRRMAASRSFSW